MQRRGERVTMREAATSDAHETRTDWAATGTLKQLQPRWWAAVATNPRVAGNAHG